MAAGDSWYTSLTKPFGGGVDTGTECCWLPFGPPLHVVNQAPDRGAVPIMLTGRGALECRGNQAPDRGAVPIMLESDTSV